MTAVRYPRTTSSLLVGRKMLRARSVGCIFPASGRARKPYFIADETSTVNGPRNPTPKYPAASAGVQARPAFCSKIALGIRRARSTECRGYFANAFPDSTVVFR